MIARTLSTELLKNLDIFPVVGLIGSRQVGKTTLAKLLISSIKKDSLYLDLELPSDLNKLTEPELFLSRHSDKCIILDEIQRMPELFPVLRSLIDQDKKAGRFLILGSASPALIRNSSETLAGRINYIELSPFNFLEINGVSDIYSHWFRGGYPDSFLAKSDQISKIWLDSFIQTYIERDLPLLNIYTSANMMRRFLTMIANYQGGIWNASNFAKSLGISSPTVSRYLDFLEESFIIHKLFPFFSNVKKRLIKSPKIYIRDSGILHRLLHLESIDDLHGNVLIGNSWEGYIIEQIKQSLPFGINLYYYRTQDGNEIDLVFSRGGKPITTAEIKFSKAPKISRGLTTAINDLGTNTNYLISLSEDVYPLKENIIVTNLSEFLGKQIREI
jgi:uncharacterized protein